jgi:hypothetical protein
MESSWTGSGFTELVVGAQHADIFFLVAQEDVDFFYGVSTTWMGQVPR